MKNKNHKPAIILALTLGALLAVISGCKKENDLAASKQPKFVALTGLSTAAGGGNSDKAAYSEDGINWKTTTMPSQANWTDVCYGGE